MSWESHDQSSFTKWKWPDSTCTIYLCYLTVLSESVYVNKESLQTVNTMPKSCFFFKYNRNFLHHSYCEKYCELILWSKAREKVCLETENSSKILSLSLLTVPSQSELCSLQKGDTIISHYSKMHILKLTWVGFIYVYASQKIQISKQLR